MLQRVAGSPLKDVGASSYYQLLVVFFCSQSNDTDGSICTKGALWIATRCKMVSCVALMNLIKSHLYS
jgi:hypothetical protein